jgi:hypothetical protein
MELLFAQQIKAYDEYKSFHFTFPLQTSGTFQVTLNWRYDFHDHPTPVAQAVVEFSGYKTGGGGWHYLNDFTPTLSADNVTELECLMLTFNCSASAVVNAFGTLVIPPISFEGLSSVALYKADTGRVVHTREVTMFAGGRIVSEQEAVEDALSQAVRLGHALAALRAEATLDHPDAAAPYRIDFTTGELLARPLRARRRLS